MSPDDPRLRALPRVDTLARTPPLAGRRAPEHLKTLAARAIIDEARAAVLADPQRRRPPAGLDALARRAAAWLDADLAPSLVGVINATGVVVHTNLGRAPLPPEAVAAGLGACTLEYALGAGRRGARRDHAERLLCAMTGAEAALIVNNNAAAVVLMLRALCRGRRVLVSRGELVEIGGSFRVPEIMATADVEIVEVGTTNRTYVSDYAAAVDADTAAILRVHPSNYRVEGFTARPDVGPLGALARERGVHLLHDLGAASLAPLPAALSQGRDRLATSLAAGADVACFSGDKSLGGPQAGVLLGRRAAIDRLSRDPLMRALRPDKLALAALQYTLSAIRAGRTEDVPVHRMLHHDLDDLRTRAESLARALEAGEGAAAGDGAPFSGCGAAAIPCEDTIGAGSHPRETLPGWAVALRPPRLGPDAVARALRTGRPPVVAVIRDGAVTLHLRTVDPSQDRSLAAAARAAVARAAAPDDAP